MTAAWEVSMMVALVAAVAILAARLFALADSLVGTDEGDLPPGPGPTADDVPPGGWDSFDDLLLEMFAAKAPA